MKTKASTALLTMLAVGGLMDLSDATAGASPSAQATTTVKGRVIITALAPRFTRLTQTTGREDVQVVVRNLTARPLAISKQDFALAAQGDLFGVHRWSAARELVVITARASRRLRLSFLVPAQLHGVGLAYRRAGGAYSSIPLPGSRMARIGSATASGSWQINTFWVTQGVGEPWGTAIDRAGNVWFADPGCDFAPTCGSSTRPGEIGEIKASSHALAFYTLPAISGNQPIFLAFDGSGNLWFTTPNNSKIGEFSPASAKFLGQWSVTSGSGPWDLVMANGSLWYTEHLGAAIGRFNLSTHAHTDFRTPTSSSNPYGIAASGTNLWFTENNSNVDRVAVLNSLTGAISEYPIVRPLSGTPHMITIGPSGRPWWTEGWSNTIATLNPSAATPGSCGTSLGTCNGIQRFALPVTAACSSGSHVSGMIYSSSAGLLWLDNSLTAQVGSFSPATSSFAMQTLSNCNAHPHDGMSLDAIGDVWFDEEFSNAIGELLP